MTIANQTTQELYSGNGSNKNFAIPFAFMSGDILNELKVYLVDADGVETLQTTPTDYTLTPGGDNPTTVVFGTAPAADEFVLVKRDLAPTQNVDLINTPQYLQPKEIEKALDRLVLMIQQLKTLSASALQVGILDLEASFSAVLPPMEAGKVLQVNDDADAFIMGEAGIGPAGPTGPAGPAGADGADGVGVPPGGTTGQVLAKINGTDYNTEWVDQSGGGGAVDSVFGRTGVVVAANGDYNAGNITNTPAGSIAATDVQAALNELDTEKQPLDADLTALAGLSGTGLVARTASNTYTQRTVTGTTDQVSVTNGDGVSGNPTLAIASNPVLPGTGFVRVPVGTTAQRPGSPLGGHIRYNTDLGASGMLETYDANSSTWVTFASPTPPVNQVDLTTPSGFGSTNTTVRNFTVRDVKRGTNITDVYNNATSGVSLTALVAGIYAIVYSGEYNTGAKAAFLITKNSSALNTTPTGILAECTSQSNDGSTTCYIGYLAANDVIRPQSFTSSKANTTSATCRFSMTQIA